MNNSSNTYADNENDYLNTTAIFGGLSRTVISKNFKGGKITNLFGGTKLDFTYADINGTAVLDISQAFGETQIAVPADWHVEAHAAHFCSTVDDARWYENRAPNTNKVLIIKGLSIFAVIDILSQPER